MLLNQSKIILIFFLFIIFSASAFGQMPGKTYVVAGISVDGNKYADESTIIALTGLRIGSELTIPGENKLQTALKNLWKRKQFSDVDISVEKITPMGIFLKVSVEEFPRLEEISPHGADKVNRKDIIEVTGKIRGDILSGYGLHLLKNDVKKLYAEEGLQFASVETELVEVGENYSRLLLNIEEGVEFKVKSINFSGNALLKSEDLEGSLEETDVPPWWAFWRSAKFDINEYAADKDFLIAYYKKHGFIDAEIIKDSVRYDEETGLVDIDIEVYEGKKLFVRDIKFEGNTVYSEYELLRRLDFEKGDPYDYELFQMNLNGNMNSTDATSLYADNGYLMVRFMPEETRVGDDSVDFTIRIMEGDRVRIRRVEIVGNSKTKDKVIRRELYTRPGDFFDRSAVIRSVRALNLLNYFNPEALRPDIKPVDNTLVDVVYKVEERSTDQINASIGFAGTFGLTGSVGLTLNNFSISEPFKGGAGQIFNINTEFGQERYQTASIGFTEPWLLDEPTTIGFNLYYQHMAYMYNLDRKGFSINIGRRFRWPDDYFRGNWSIRIQDNKVSTSTSSSYYSQYYRNGTELTIGQTLQRISLNNMFFPTYGSRFSLSTQWAMGALGIGDFDFLKNIMKFDMAYSLMQFDGNDRLVLFIGTQLGYVKGLQSDTNFSPIEMFHMGGNGLSGFGVTPLRGYEDHSIGSQDGSRVMTKYTAELRFAISLDPMPIYVYAFGEAGNVWSDLGTTDLFNLKRSAGLGIQMNINPLGVIGFSYGYGFDAPGLVGEKSGWKFLFHLGQQ
ncbi:MAG: outer membrane protein assembly factor BamA [Candidatus Kapabacteria bacterium]|jgi:outer membrane protein insertion porin family|nr:outer membrane protein assembly factor BamA [Candidatus Kapabacteria bacterium]